ncbi:hypothetical protein [Blastococcus sp. PRF04-17]|uniref:hypothetical protein n=1 Tax=Blastococcus sp. PRF04-17 TaxID=2933797 RepID=UPI001FF17643|nr:hypothetical protein [Blastococcus sp. PRF04-17]UOX99934.1 hypothetical protein MVA48_12930 [Blastococcus sp. PRF04-17]
MSRDIASGQRPPRCEGLFDLVVLVDQQPFGTGIDGTLDRFLALTRPSASSS